MFQKWSKYFTYGVFVIGLSGCTLLRAPQYAVVGNVHSLSALQKVHATPKRQVFISSNPVRKQNLRDYALSLGAQIGCADQTDALNRMLHEFASELDKIFNFNLIVLKHGLLPPVLIQGEKSIRQVDNKTIRIADRIYQIYKPAEMATTLPNWRTYLMREGSYCRKAELTALVPDLLPQTLEEQKIWETAVQEGGVYGVNEARSNFLADLNALSRDFTGML